MRARSSASEYRQRGGEGFLLMAGTGVNPQVLWSEGSHYEERSNSEGLEEGWSPLLKFFLL